MKDFVTVTVALRLGLAEGDGVLLGEAQAVGDLDWEAVYVADVVTAPEAESLEVGVRVRVTDTVFTNVGDTVGVTEGHAVTVADIETVGE